MNHNYSLGDEEEETVADVAKGPGRKGPPVRTKSNID